MKSIDSDSHGFLRCPQTSSWIAVEIPLCCPSPHYRYDGRWHCRYHPLHRAGGMDGWVTSALGGSPVNGRMTPYTGTETHMHARCPGLTPFLDACSVQWSPLDTSIVCVILQYFHRLWLRSYLCFVDFFHMLVAFLASLKSTFCKKPVLRMCRKRSKPTNWSRKPRICGLVQRANSCFSISNFGITAP